MRTRPMPQQPQQPLVLFSKMYSDVNLQKWHAIIEAAHQYGIWIDTAQGEQETFGVKFAWNYNETARRLDVRILQAGLVSEAEALQFLDQIISQA